MKILYRILSLILAFQLGMPATLLQAKVEQAKVEQVKVDSSDDDLPPPPAGYENCTPGSRIPSKEKPCCTNLEERNGRCWEKEWVDPSITACTGHSSCPTGMGCYSQRAKDLFKNDIEKKGYLEGQVYDWQNRAKGLNETCTHSQECSSYYCEYKNTSSLLTKPIGVCKDRGICRLADLGESAPNNIQCADGLVKNAQGKCEKDPNSTEAVYLGLVADPKINVKGQCQFDISAETRERALVAMKSLRAMEFTFATASGSSTQPSEHIGLSQHMKETMQTFYESRKEVLANFNRIFDQIENDNATLLRAREKDISEIKIHNAANGLPETMTAHELATRQSSGYDALMMMWRRNLLFQSYETQMQLDIHELEKKIASLNEEMPKWEGQKDKWILNGQERTGHQEYKKWDWWNIWPGWKTKKYRHIEALWKRQYLLGPGDVSGLLEHEQLLNYLRHIVAQENVAPYLQLTAPTPFGMTALSDPLMPGNLDYNQYGTPISYFTKCGSSQIWQVLGVFLSFGTVGLAIWGGPDVEQCRKAPFTPRNLSIGQYKKMLDDLRPKVKEFYAGLKTHQNQKDFIYEPELIAAQGQTSGDQGNEAVKACSANSFDPKTGVYVKCARDCIEKPGNPGCQNYPKFFDEIAEISFAQFIAYSLNVGISYRNYFDNEQSWRRRLFTQLDADLVFLGRYYSEILKIREKQNECIEKVINKVVDDLNDDKNSGGLTEGKNYYATPTQYNNDRRQRPTNSGFQLARLTPASRANFSFGGANGTIGSGGSNLDNISAASGGAGASSSSTGASAAFAKRMNELRKANQRSSLRGVNIESKERALKIASSSLGHQVGAPRGPSSAATDSTLASNALPALQVSGKEAKLEGELDVKGEDLDIKASGGPGGGGSVGTGMVGGVAGGAFSGVSDYQSTLSESSSPAQYTDPTGMSDEEKDVLMANYERTRGQYETKEDDGLFKIVSKAYVRNLEKILTRKKSLD